MKTCALVIGHKKSSPGAVNAGSGMTEFFFNELLAASILEKAESLDNIKIVLVKRKLYKDLPEQINALHPDFIISLHCNAFDRKTSGSEVLYYHTSDKGHLAAEILSENITAALGLPDRGLKPLTTEDRGGYLLRYTKAPCVISEPFFIDNNNDLKIAQEHFSRLIDAYVNAIEEIYYNIDLVDCFINVISPDMGI